MKKEIIDEKDKMMSKKKKYSMIMVLLIVFMILLTSTFAWRDVLQHGGNDFEFADIQNNVALIDNFAPVKNWKENETHDKEVYVRNGPEGAINDDYDDAYIRVQLKEYLELGKNEYNYHENRYMIDVHGHTTESESQGKGDFLKFNNASDAAAYIANHLPDHDPNGYEKKKSYLEDKEYFYIISQENDPNGKYGKLLPKSKKDDVAARPLIPGSVRATDESGNSGIHVIGDKMACDYPVHLWSSSSSQKPHAESPFLDYVSWELGNVSGRSTIMTLEDWNASKPSYPVWIADTGSKEGWLYWSEAVPYGEKTDKIIEKVTLKDQPESGFYSIHVDMDAVNINDLHKWTDMPPEIGTELGQQNFFGTISIDVEGPYVRGDRHQVIVRGSDVDNKPFEAFDVELIEAHGSTRYIEGDSKLFIGHGEEGPVTIKARPKGKAQPEATFTIHKSDIESPSIRITNLPTTPVNPGYRLDLEIEGAGNNPHLSLKNQSSLKAGTVLTQDGRLRIDEFETASTISIIVLPVGASKQSQFDIKLQIIEDVTISNLEDGQFFERGQDYPINVVITGQNIIDDKDMTWSINDETTSAVNGISFAGNTLQIADDATIGEKFTIIGYPTKNKKLKKVYKNLEVTANMDEIADVDIKLETPLRPDQSSNFEVIFREKVTHDRLEGIPYTIEKVNASDDFTIQDGTISIGRNYLEDTIKLKVTSEKPKYSKQIELDINLVKDIEIKKPVMNANVKRNSEIPIEVELDSHGVVDEGYNLEFRKEDGTIEDKITIFENSSNKKMLRIDPNTSLGRVQIKAISKENNNVIDVSYIRIVLSELERPHKILQKNSMPQYLEPGVQGVDIKGHLYAENNVGNIIADAEYDFSVASAVSTNTRIDRSTGQLDVGLDEPEGTIEIDVTPYNLPVPEVRIEFEVRPKIHKIKHEPIPVQRPGSILNLAPYGESTTGARLNYPKFKYELLSSSSVNLNTTTGKIDVANYAGEETVEIKVTEIFSDKSMNVTFRIEPDLALGANITLYPVYETGKDYIRPNQTEVPLLVDLVSNTSGLIKDAELEFTITHISGNNLRANTKITDGKLNIDERQSETIFEISVNPVGYPLITDTIEVHVLPEVYSFKLLSPLPSIVYPNSVHYFDIVSVDKYYEEISVTPNLRITNQSELKNGTSINKYKQLEVAFDEKEHDIIIEATADSITKEYKTSVYPKIEKITHRVIQGQIPGTSYVLRPEALDLDNDVLEYPTFKYEFLESPTSMYTTLNKHTGVLNIAIDEAIGTLRILITVNEDTSQTLEVRVKIVEDVSLPGMTLTLKEIDGDFLRPGAVHELDPVLQDATGKEKERDIEYILTAMGSELKNNTEIVSDTLTIDDEQAESTLSIIAYPENATSPSYSMDIKVVPLANSIKIQKPEDDIVGPRDIKNLNPKAYDKKGNIINYTKPTIEILNKSDLHSETKIVGSSLQVSSQEREGIIQLRFRADNAYLDYTLKIQPPLKTLAVDEEIFLRAGDEGHFISAIGLDENGNALDYIKLKYRQVTTTSIPTTTITADGKITIDEQEKQGDFTIEVSVENFPDTKLVRINIMPNLDRARLELASFPSGEFLTPGSDRFFLNPQVYDSYNNKVEGLEFSFDYSLTAGTNQSTNTKVDADTNTLYTDIEQEETLLTVSVFVQGYEYINSQVTVWILPKVEKIFYSIPPNKLSAGSVHDFAPQAKDAYNRDLSTPVSIEIVNNHIITESDTGIFNNKLEISSREREKELSIKISSGKKNRDLIEKFHNVIIYSKPFTSKLVNAPAPTELIPGNSVNGSFDFYTEFYTNAPEELIKSLNAKYSVKRDDAFDISLETKFYPRGGLNPSNRDEKSLLKVGVDEQEGILVVTSKPDDSEFITPQETYYVEVKPDPTNIEIKGSGTKSIRAGERYVLNPVVTDYLGRELVHPIDKIEYEFDPNLGEIDYNTHSFVANNSLAIGTEISIRARVDDVYSSLFTLIVQERALYLKPGVGHLDQPANLGEKVELEFINENNVLVEPTRVWIKSGQSHSSPIEHDSSSGKYFLNINKHETNFELIIRVEYLDDLYDIPFYIKTVSSLNFINKENYKVLKRGISNHQIEYELKGGPGTLNNDQKDLTVTLEPANDEIKITKNDGYLTLNIPKSVPAFSEYELKIKSKFNSKLEDSLKFVVDIHQSEVLGIKSFKVVPVIREPGQPAYNDLRQGQRAEFKVLYKAHDKDPGFEIPTEFVLMSPYDQHATIDGNMITVKPTTTQNVMRVMLKPKVGYEVNIPQTFTISGVRAINVIVPSYGGNRSSAKYMGRGNDHPINITYDFFGTATSYMRNIDGYIYDKGGNIYNASHKMTFDGKTLSIKDKQEYFEDFTLEIRSQHNPLAKTTLPIKTHFAGERLGNFVVVGVHENYLPISGDGQRMKIPDDYLVQVLAYDGIEKNLTQTGLHSTLVGKGSFASVQTNPASPVKSFKDQDVDTPSEGDAFPRKAYASWLQTTEGKQYTNHGHWNKVTAININNKTPYAFPASYQEYKTLVNLPSYSRTDWLPTGKTYPGRMRSNLMFKYYGVSGFTHFEPTYNNPFNAWKSAWFRIGNYAEFLPRKGYDTHDGVIRDSIRFPQIGASSAYSSPLGIIQSAYYGFMGSSEVEVRNLTEQAIYLAYRIVPKYQ